MTTTQRVDVARLSELLAVMASSDPNRMTEFPGGCDCYECGNIFIGGAGHDYCAQCEAKRQLLAMLPEALPALLQQLAEAERAREESVELIREVLERDRVRYLNGECVCINHSRKAELEYESGTCPHQRIAAFLAANGGGRED